MEKEYLYPEDRETKREHALGLVLPTSVFLVSNTHWGHSEYHRKMFFIMVEFRYIGVKETTLLGSIMQQKVSRI